MNPLELNMRFLRLKITLGLKILIGVALVSNCFMGLLVYSNYTASQKINFMTAQITEVRKELSAHLRETIVDLQHDFGRVPELFTNDPKTAILNYLKSNHLLGEKKRFAGRKNYSKLFTRTQKRDLAKGKVVLTIRNGQALVSYGLFDNQGDFTATIEQYKLLTPHPEQDITVIQQHIQEMYTHQSSVEDLEEKIRQLKVQIADKGIEAERVRTEILSHVDHINSMERQLETRKNNQYRMGIATAALVIFSNLIVLFFITRIVVERPLHRLTSVVADLGKGNFPEIPMQSRNDQIGVLSKAMSHFRDVLQELKEKGSRQKEEQLIISELIESVTVKINELDERTRGLTTISLQLESLSKETTAKTETVTMAADSTASLTLKFAEASQKLTNCTHIIHEQMEDQDRVTEQIVASSGMVNNQLEQLKLAVTEIASAIASVYKITDQTKILALNATIEAVKAGDVGKGFGIVAQEIKDLSQQTAGAAEEIMEKVQAINTISQGYIEFVETMNNNAKKLEQVTASIGSTATEQQLSIDTIIEQTTRTTDKTHQVSSNIADVHSATEQIFMLSCKASRYSEKISRELGSLLNETTEKLTNLRKVEPPAPTLDGGEKLT